MKVTSKLVTISMCSIFSLASLSGFAGTKYPKIYPFVPKSVSHIHEKVKYITEDEDYIDNFFDITDKGLSSAKTKSKPWTSTYWPLNRGLIADPYATYSIPYYVDIGFVSWTRNYKSFNKRINRFLNNSDKFSDETLSMLAPSEKYDILMGDKTFDLTRRLWDYMQKWGSNKEHAFLTKLGLIGEDALELADDMVNNPDKLWFESVDEAYANAYQLSGSLVPEIALKLVKEGKYGNVQAAHDEAMILAQAEAQNYVLEKKNSLMAFWEGICHGWALAAGHLPRPKKSVSFQLRDNRNLKFYPEDIKGLASLAWANSLIQDSKDFGGGVMMVGKRCNLEKPKKDKFGRKYDNRPDPFSGDHDNRCAGVHPAIWHLSLVNLIGKQGRSFVVERKVSHEVDNHPMYGYSMSYFKPGRGGLVSDPAEAIEKITSDDQFFKYRSAKAKYIVGVETKMTYTDWVKPRRAVTDSDASDKTETKKMIYDLELDENFKIVGGQWRAKRRGKPSPNRHRSSGAAANRRNKGNYNQPDFFWTVTKDWKSFFEEDEDLNSSFPWVDKTKAPPKEWRETTMKKTIVEKGQVIQLGKYNGHVYFNEYQYGTGQRCKYIHKKTGKRREVPCESRINKPRPVINVINALIERAQ